MEIIGKILKEGFCMRIFLGRVYLGLVCTAALIVLFFVRGITLYGGGSDEVRIYYYQTDENGFDFFEHYIIAVPEVLCTEHRAFVIFGEVFGGLNPNTMLFTPKEAKMLKVNFFPNHKLLKITLSKETLNYGGTYFEHKFVKRLIKNASQLKGVEYLTISVEGSYELVYISSHYLVVLNQK
jgi:hypothetical protein